VVNNCNQLALRREIALKDEGVSQLVSQRPYEQLEEETLPQGSASLLSVQPSMDCRVNSPCPSVTQPSLSDSLSLPVPFC
jgi:hypothetical protein